jgi:hypothetical protein
MRVGWGRTVGSDIGESGVNPKLSAIITLCIGLNLELNIKPRCKH